MIPAISNYKYYDLPTMEQEQEYASYVREIEDRTDLTQEQRDTLKQRKATELGI